MSQKGIYNPEFMKQQCLTVYIDEEDQRDEDPEREGSEGDGEGGDEDGG